MDWLEYWHCKHQRVNGEDIEVDPDFCIRIDNSGYNTHFLDKYKNEHLVLWYRRSGSGLGQILDSNLCSLETLNEVRSHLKSEFSIYHAAKSPIPSCV